MVEVHGRVRLHVSFDDMEYSQSEVLLLEYWQKVGTKRVHVFSTTGSSSLDDTTDVVCCTYLTKFATKVSFKTASFMGTEAFSFQKGSWLVNGFVASKLKALLRFRTV